MTDLKTFFAENDKLVAGLAATAAIVVSLFSLFVAVKAMALQRAHNRKSTIPIGFFSMGDYENHVFVRLNSEGVGPLIIDRISVKNSQTNKDVGTSLIEVMPKGIIWETFVRDIRGRALRPDKDILLITRTKSLLPPVTRCAMRCRTSRCERNSIRCTMRNLAPNAG
jgi:hypothetical protein